MFLQPILSAVSILHLPCSPLFYIIAMPSGYFLVPGGIQFNMKISNKFQFFQSIALFAALAACVLLLKYPQYAKNGISEALGSCFKIIVPSLFPMLVLSGFISGGNLPEKLEKILHRPMIFLFGISGSSAMSLLLGLLGGYPLSVKTAFLLREKNSEAKEDAKRMALFMTSPGLSFAVSIAGGVYYHSYAAGCSFLLSCILSNLLCAFIYNRLKPRRTACSTTARQNPAELSLRLTSAVSGAAAAIINICAWITAFSAFFSLLTPFISGTKAEIPLNLIAEVTLALKTSALLNNANISVFSLAFGGFCVFFQLLPEIKALGIRPLIFLSLRFVSALLASLLQSLTGRIFGLAVSANAGFAPVKISENSIAGSAALLFMCFIFLLQTADVKNKSTAANKQKIQHY